MVVEDMVEALGELLLLGACRHSLPHKGAYTPLRGLSKLLLYASNFFVGSLFDESVG
jgi:hypothetical protein